MTESHDVVDRIATVLGQPGSVSPELDWDTVERGLGTAFPDDYKQFMGRFPSGMFRDVLRIFNPVQNENFLTHFTDQFENTLIGVEILWQESGGFPPFPRPGGVLPFASDTSGGALLWLPWTPDPGKWHVVHLSRNTTKGYTRTKRPATAVLLELATSRSDRNILGWDLSAKEQSFTPF